MALTEYQCSILRLLAGERKERGERYVAGGAALNVLLSAPRLSRDIDVITCDQKLQPFGYLVWAACGKDPGYNPHSLLAIARRQRYSHAEVDTLAFSDYRPDAALLGSQWHQILEEAERIVTTLPPEEFGTGVMDDRGELCTAAASSLENFVHEGRIRFHTGSIGGVWPQIKDRI